MISLSNFRQYTNIFQPYSKTFQKNRPSKIINKTTVVSQQTTYVDILKESGWELVEDVINTDYSSINNQEIGPLLEAYDACRRLLRSNEVTQFIPEIVVVGDQSSGKSSLLETISGINLPRGDGMVTKVPLELQLRCNEKQEAKLFYQEKEIPIENLSNIPDEIRKAQGIIVGDQKNVQDDVIQLKISSNNLPNLTLTDQPGLIHNVLPGQPLDLPDRIRKLAEKHTQGSSKVILCIVPGNVDPSTCLALSIAEKQDPENQRTICVITKVDMGLKSEFNIGSVVDHLDHKHYEYVAVRNRTAKEAQSGLSMLELRKIEKEMIGEELQEYIPSEYCGVSVLIKRLVEIQREILWNSLQDVTQKVDEALQNVDVQLYRLPVSIENKYQAHRIIQGILQDIQEDLYSLKQQPSIKNYKSLSKIIAEDTDTQLTTTAMLQSEFETFLKELQENLEKPQFLDKTKIENIINLSKPFSGTQLPNFSIYKVPVLLYDRYLWSTLKSPSQKLTNTVHKNIEELLFEIVKKRCEKYPRLATQLNNNIKTFSSEIKNSVNDKLDYLLNLEKVPYTQDTTYMNDLKRWAELFNNNNNQQQNNNNMGTNQLKESFGISTILPELGKSWEEQARELAEFVKNNQTNDNLEALQIMFSLASIAGVLFRRYVDNLCLMLRYMYLEELPDTIIDKCNINEDQAWALLRNQGAELKRAKLEKEKQTRKRQNNCEIVIEKMKLDKSIDQKDKILIYFSTTISPHNRRTISYSNNRHSKRQTYVRIFHSKIFCFNKINKENKQSLYVMGGKWQCQL
eukprot:TRINITY_DN7870_c0_g1_i2.p1 TRINITY_DN7870_c0_g1~~TRINITY_DN7870_c0_g1_i2.p1  ORF type:complete len:843 (-),score=76.17 TRINITY_DN7870_c0_g1_i2:272-2662(-)